MRPHRTSAVTLLELAIATAIFGTVLVITIEALTNVRRFVSTTALDDTLADEAEVVLAAISEDLANSAWMIDASTDVALLADASEVSYDRDGARYYPYVVVQDYATATTSDPAPLQIAKNGVPATSGWYQDFKRGPDEIVTPTMLLASKPNLPPSHLGASQELIFLKVRQGEASDDPDFIPSSWVDFNDDPAPMGAYSDPDRLPVIDALTLADDGAQVVDMPLSWETGLGVDAWDGATNSFDADRLRHYTYALVPGGPYGSRLERRYRTEVGDPVESHVVLSSSVDRLIIDTYRTSSQLGVNQVRVRVWLSRPSDEDPTYPLTHYAETTIALRSTVDPEYSLKLDDWLGSAGDFGL